VFEDFFSPISTKDKVTAIPILVRAAYHFDVISNLDLYLVGKIGYAFGSWGGDLKDELEGHGETVGAIGGFGFGFDVGAAYYFTSNIGAFIEGGFDRYDMKIDIDVEGYKINIEAPFSHFLTFGLSYKF
jgi:hypothetical protein